MALEIPILLFVGALLGIAANVGYGWSKSGAPFSLQNALGALIAGIAGSIVAILGLDLTNLNYPLIQLLVGFITGFGSDKIITKLKTAGYVRKNQLTK